jgi:hypothetical protein
MYISNKKYFVFVARWSMKATSRKGSITRPMWRTHVFRDDLNGPERTVSVHRIYKEDAIEDMINFLEKWQNSFNMVVIEHNNENPPYREVRDQTFKKTL